MPEIQKPLPFEELDLKPPLIGKPKLTDEIQQTLALLSGWDGATRRLVAVSPTGALYFAEPRVKGIINKKAVGDDYDYQFDDIPTSEVFIRAKPTNSGRIWVNVYAAAADNVGYPLDSGEYVNLSISNLHSLHMNFTKGDDYAIVVYTR